MDKINNIMRYISNFDDIQDLISLNMNQVVKNHFNLKKVTATCVVLTYNEERCIKRCLEHIIEVFDEIIIIDTGSNDSTKKIISEFKNQKIKLFDFEWCDNFSKVRNFGINQANSDWVVFIDADEIFEISNKYRLYEILALFDNVIQKKDISLSFEIHEKNTEFIFDDIPRMIYKNGNCRYYGNVHEEIRSNKKECVLIKTTIKLVHDGYSEKVISKKEKKKRNILLLSKCIKNEPNNLRWYYYYSRDGMGFIDNVEHIRFVKSILDKYEEKFKLESLENNAVYYFKLIMVYMDLLIKVGKINEIDQTIKKYNLEKSDFYDIQFYKSLSKLINIEIEYEILLKELFEFRKNNFEKQDSSISKDGTHIDLLIGALLFETKRFEDSKKYFDFIGNKLDGAIDKKLIDSYRDIINKIESK